MQAPHDQSGESGALCFLYNEVTDAGLIETAAVVDDKHVTRRATIDGLQEDVDAADMACGQDASDQAAAGDSGPHACGRAPNVDLRADARVREVWCRQRSKALLKLIGTHVAE